jgi:hypothetical protein
MHKTIKYLIYVIQVLLMVFLISVFMKSTSNFYDFALKTNTKGGRFSSYLKEGFESHLSKIYSIFYSSSSSLFKRVDIFVDSNDLSDLNNDLPSSGFRYKKGIFVADGISYESKFRYRGDYFVHWAYDKKSIRVKSKKNNLYNNVNKFNFIAPKTNSQINNYASYKLANHLSLISPNVEFVNLNLNNKYYGVTYYIDQIDESFLRNRYLMPGDIYRGEIWGRTKVINSKNYLENNLFNSEKLWEKVSVNNHYSEDSLAPLSKLIQLIKKIRISGEGIEELEDMFDLEYMARFSLYESLTSSYHYDRTHNWRLYFDPWKLKFYPIVWDTFGFHEDWRYTYKDIPIIDPRVLTDLHISLLKSGKFITMLNKANYELANSNVLKDFLRDIQIDVKKIKKEIVRDPGVRIFFDKSTLIKDIDSTFNFIQKIISKFLNDYSGKLKIKPQYYSKSNNIYVSLDQPNNFNQLIIQFNKPIDNLKNIFIHSKSNINGNKLEKKIKTNYELLNSYSIKINNNFLPNFEFIKTNESTSLWKKQLFKKGVYKIEFEVNSNLPQVLNIDFCNSNECIDAKLENDIANLFEKHYFNFFNYVELQNNLITLKGDFVVDSNLHFNNPVSIEPGTKFIIHKGKNIFFNNDLFAYGTKNEPIIFNSLNDISEPWGTVAIKGNSAILSNVLMKNGSGYKNEFSEYSGMLSIHNVKKVYISDSIFEKSSIVDDMVHIVYSKGIIENCIFRNSFSDAIDIDISDFRLRNNKFYNSGNDALDLMSSRVISNGNHFESSKDKGISVGEKTSLHSLNDTFISNEIGIEIKDQSMMYSNFASFNGNKLSINLYDKNWRYEGGGNAFIENINSDFNLDFQVKNKSVLFIESSTKKYFNNKKVINLNNIEISQREIIKDKFITNLNLLNDKFEFNKHFN